MSTTSEKTRQQSMETSAQAAPPTEEKTEKKGTTAPRRPIPVRLAEMQAPLLRMAAEAMEMDGDLEKARRVRRHLLTAEQEMDSAAGLAEELLRAAQATTPAQE